MAAIVEKILKQNKVVVFSKSYCPYCNMAKKVLNEVGVVFEVLELDNEDDNGIAIQDHLLALTGARTVPRVFIGGKCIGGGTETEELKRKGKLVPLLEEIGAL